MSDTSFRIEEGDFSSPFFLSDTPHYPYLLPEGWEWCRLNEIAESSLGKTLDKSRNTGKVYPYLCAINVKWNDFDLSVVKTIRLEDNEKERYQVLKGDLLICEGGDVGRSAIWDSDEPIYYQNALHRVRFFGNIVANFYLYLIWCYKNHNWIDDICNGVTIKHFTQDKINALYFPLPPVAEQQRIVAEIKRWFSLIDIIETGKDDLQTTIKQAKSKILDLAIHGKLVPQDPNDEPAIELLKRINPDFTPCDNGHYTFKIPNSWTWCKLGDIAQSNIGLTYKPTDITDNGIPVYRSNNIRDRKIDKSDLVRVNAPILEKQFLNIGDLLICARNGSRRLVGKCAIIEELDEVTSFGAFMAVCRSEYNQWIFNLLNTTYFDRYLDDSNSTAINQVTQRMLLALHIPLPPLSEQQRIVQKIEELFSVLDNIQNALEV